MHDAAALRAAMLAKHQEARPGWVPPGLDDIIAGYYAAGPLTDDEIAHLDQLDLGDRIRWVQQRYGPLAWPAALADRRRRAGR